MKINVVRILGAVALAGIGFVAGRASGSDTVVEASQQQGTRVFELRTYTTHPGKLDALHKRFRDHTVKLFEKHGMTNVVYTTPMDSPASENTLIYLLAHKSREAGKASWEAFRKDPEWVKARTESEVPGPIVVKADSVFLTPTDYSPMK